MHHKLKQSMHYMNSTIVITLFALYHTITHITVITVRPSVSQLYCVSRVKAAASLNCPASSLAHSRWGRGWL